MSGVSYCRINGHVCSNIANILIIRRWFNRWLNLAKKTVVLTSNKIRLKALFLVLSVWICIWE